MRHSERLDETSGREAWWASTPPSRWFDSPITARGVALVQPAVEALKQQQVRLSAIYVSPQLRCVQTAAEVAKAFGMVSDD
jgi:broad specificity phosphatase PhoE